MATVQVSDGTSPVTNSSTVNNGGTVVNGGTLDANNPMTVNKSVADLADGRDSEYGSKVVAQDGTAVEDEDYAGVQAAKSGGGGLAFQPKHLQGQRNFLIRGAGTADGTNKINNVASDILVSPASEVQLRQVNDIHVLETTRQLGTYATAKFDVLARPSTAMVPGRTKGTGAGSLTQFVDPAVLGGATPSDDEAANPTREVPGELVYRTSAKLPVEDDYKARDSHEA